MPLLDHFHSPLLEKRHWESFHGSWAYEIMAQLNRDVLPTEYFAEAQVHVGSRVEVDVASFEHGESANSAETNGGVAIHTWSPPSVTSQMPAVFPDEIEVRPHVHRQRAQFPTCRFLEWYEEMLGSVTPFEERVRRN